MITNVEEIKHALTSKENTLFITNRRAGKTTALLELIHEECNSYILTLDNCSKKLMIERYKEMFDDYGYQKIFAQNEAYKLNMENVYIDEYFFHDKLYTEFKGAVGSLRFPIEIKRFKVDNSQSYSEFLES